MGHNLSAAGNINDYNQLFMKPAIRFVKPTILMLIMITKILTVISLFTGCQSNEPAFIVKGDKIVTKDIKVNVEVLKQDSTIMAFISHVLKC